MKKIVKLLVLLICVFSLAGCNGSDSDVNFKEDTTLQQSLLSQVKEFQNNVLQMTDEEIQTIIDSDEEEDEVMSDALSSWTSITDIGEYESGEFNTMSAKLNTSSATYTCTLHFTERDVEMDVVFEDIDGNVEITSVTYTTVYSLGEQMAEAGLNTLMGMGIVFLVLIFISFIISLFKYIPKITEYFEKSKSDSDKVKEVEEVTNDVDTNVSDDSELIAIIAAAIAASEGTSTDSFVVRTIKRREANKWHRA